MEQRTNLIRYVAAMRTSLRSSEKKVADLVLTAPSPIIQMSLAQLARAVDVSEPSVVRFCRSVGCDGFRDFKLQLAQSLVTGTPYVHGDIQRSDDMGRVSSKIFASAINTLEAVRERISTEALNKAAEALDAAKRIDVFALGLTSAVGLDAQQKFLRFDIPVVYHMDATLQTMAAATLMPGDVALVFSYHGQQRELMRTVQTAKQNGATVICVTRTGSRLGQFADITVGIDTEEDTFIYAPMTTRIAHMAVVDILATGVALRRGPEAIERFKKIKATVRAEQFLGLPEPD